MWYVIRTTTGREHEVCLWINTFIYRKHYRRCFVLLYEDVWKKQGIGHISAKNCSPGIYLSNPMSRRSSRRRERMSGVDWNGVAEPMIQLIKKSRKSGKSRKPETWRYAWSAIMGTSMTTVWMRRWNWSGWLMPYHRFLVDHTDIYLAAQNMKGSMGWGRCTTI